MPFGSDPFRDAWINGKENEEAEAPMPFGSDPFRDLPLG